MKLTQRLLIGSLLIVGVLVALVVAILDGRLRLRFYEESSAALLREARLVAAQWRPGLNVDSLANAAGGALGHRVTLIDSSGKVVGDSEFDPPALGELENHLTRPEVQDALRGGTGTSRRVSPSAGDEELYAAVRSGHGVARVSVSAVAIQQLFARARADVLVAAVGRPRLVQGDWVKPGAAVIDVGINRLEAGVVGDVDFDPAAQRAGVITPVPRGVGPMTVACLLRNTLLAAQAAA